MEKDYLIIGQGIAGSMIAYELMKRHATVDIYNRTDERTSSQVAAGLYNPVTGRKMVKTWNADAIFADLEQYYQSLEKVLKARFLHSTGIYRPFFTQEEQNEWQGRIADGNYKMFIEELKTASCANAEIRDPYGGLQLTKAGYVNIPVMLKGFRSYFESNTSYQEKIIDWNNLKLVDGGVKYNDVVYKQIVFCEGNKVADNPWFDWLPMKPVKGEIIDVNIAYDESFILNRGVFLLPENEKGLCRIGSTYDNHRLDHELTEEAIAYLREKLGIIFDGDPEVVNHRAGIRPATRDRKPFLGRHPANREMIIFNGLGAKGVSLAAYYAVQLANYLENEKPLDEEVNIARFFSFYPN
ncbi:MAG: FAD-dependent oxidoreductase [Cyclobacteriaceae bacterium]